MNVRISVRAQSDLDLIFAYIHLRQSPQAALRFLDRAQKAVQFISQHPLGGPRPQWRTRHATLRFRVIDGTNYLIYYIPDEIGVSIERVLDGRRDVKRIIELDAEEPPGDE